MTYIWSRHAHFSRFEFLARCEKNWPISREKMREMREKICTVKRLHFGQNFGYIFFQNIADCKAHLNLIGISRIHLVEHFLCIRKKISLKITQILVKLDWKSAKIGPIFPQFLAAAFLARNVSQNHFSFSREMREMCMSIRK